MEPTGFEQMCMRVRGLNEVLLAIVNMVREHGYGKVTVHIHNGVIHTHFIETSHKASTD